MSYYQNKTKVYSKNLHNRNVTLVTCRDCQNFIKFPNSSDQASGQCRALEEYRNRGASDAQIYAAEKKLGNHAGIGTKTFYPALEPYRECVKYISKNV
jgi:hypothetical protein